MSDFIVEGVKNQAARALGLFAVIEATIILGTVAFFWPSVEPVKMGLDKGIFVKIVDDRGVELLKVENTDGEEVWNWSKKPEYVVESVLKQEYAKAKAAQAQVK